MEDIQKNSEKINNALKEMLVRKQRELDVLYEVSCAMRTTLELEHILYIILTGVTSHTGLGYNRAILFLANSKTRNLECKMYIGPESGEHAEHIWKYFKENNPPLEDLIQEEKVHSLKKSIFYDSLKSLSFPIGPENQFLLTQAYWRANPWHLTQEEIVKFASDPFFGYFQTSDLIIMPLEAKDKINGLIVADNIYTKKPITDEDIKIFTMLADQAALAIENSNLYEIIVQKSHTDALTSLWNHGFFQNKLSTLIGNTIKEGNSLSLLIMDIDNFKSLNDKFGHQYGDIILKEMAKLLKDSSRDMDYICRYGGEEFSFILDKANKDQAYEIAERLRKRIQSHAFTQPPMADNITITVSIGLSCCPEHVRTKDELIAYADKAMYIAKFSGKNKTCVAESND